MARRPERTKRVDQHGRIGIIVLNNSRLYGFRSALSDGTNIPSTMRRSEVPARQIQLMASGPVAAKSKRPATNPRAAARRRQVELRSRLYRWSVSPLTIVQWRQRKRQVIRKTSASSMLPITPRQRPQDRSDTQMALMIPTSWLFFFRYISRRRYKRWA